MAVMIVLNESWHGEKSGDVLLLNDDVEDILIRLMLLV